jgi:phytoene synthase
MDVDDYCRDKVAAEGSVLYYSLLFVPDAARRALTALRALGEELREVTDACSDLNVGRSKLAWWSEEIAWTSQGKARHPVTQSMAASIESGKIDEARYRALLDGMGKRLEAGGFGSRGEMNSVLGDAEGALGALVADVCAGGEADHLAFQQKLHLALAHAWIARNPRRHGWRSFTYLPEDELARHGVTREDVFSEKTSEALRKVVKLQLDHALNQIDQAIEALPANRGEVHLPFLAEAKMERAALKALARSGGRVLEKPPMITPIRKLWIAWRTAKRMGV